MGLKKHEKLALPISLSPNTLTARILCKMLCPGEDMAKQYYAVSEAILVRAVTQPWDSL